MLRLVEKKLYKPHLQSYIEYPGKSGRVALIEDLPNGNFVIKVVDEDNKLHKVLGSDWNRYLDGLDKE